MDNHGFLFYHGAVAEGRSKTGDRSNKKKGSKSLVGMSSMAVLAVYGAGFVRTQSVADRLAARAAEWRAALPGGPAAAPHVPNPISQSGNSPVSAPSPAPSVVPSTMNSVSDTPAPAASAESVPARAEVPRAAAAVPFVSAIGSQSATATPAPVEPEYKDGTYYGWGASRHGEVQAAVVIEGGNISSVKVAQCLTRYSCDVTTRFSPYARGLQMPQFYWVSGATDSFEAFHHAVLDALSKVK